MIKIGEGKDEMQDSDRAKSGVARVDNVRFATVCDVCCCLTPGVIMNPCGAFLALIPLDLRRDWEAEKGLRRQVHHYCRRRVRNEPLTAQIIADCRAVIQPLIEATPDAYWGIKDNQQLFS
jgi:hypothetical protein